MYRQKIGTALEESEKIKGIKIKPEIKRIVAEMKNRIYD